MRTRVRGMVGTLVIAACCFALALPSSVVFLDTTGRWGDVQAEARGPASALRTEQSAMLADMSERLTDNFSCDISASERQRRQELSTCTHGPDQPPDGLQIDSSVRPLASRSLASRGWVACDGDGYSGFRVQVLYVRGSDVTSRLAQYGPSMQTWVQDANQIFIDSSMETGGVRSLRFDQDDSCVPTITEVVIPPDADDLFPSMVIALKSAGYDQQDRIYLTFVDTTSAGICGIGTLKPDDKPGQTNINNSGPSFARVDAGCWSEWVAAHEIMHALGAVQPSAPNANRVGHCIDEYDVMCQEDVGSSIPPMRFVCTDLILDVTRFDCNDDDYFNVSPGPGTYLATHWNAANSRFLLSDGSGPTVNPTPPSSNTPTAPAKHKKKKKGKKKHKRH